ncbi:class D beta-lactamase [Fluviispira vulneris]|uniref:class D beta-lactamase n=1 Tax=Fluviispira vulneris TaxID=2763012 RepID=UPI001648C1DD|nr:class D beta-lactamase [Fluviispira vulneris]
MKRVFCIMMLSTLSAQAKDLNYKDYYRESTGCFILYDLNKNKIIEEYNDQFCQIPMPPNSTFKIPLSIMGFDKNILKDENTPKWEFKEEYLTEGFKSWMPVQWKEENTPKSWLKYSVVWYSQKLTRSLGTKAIENYLNLFDYGNKDFSGTPGKNDALMSAWIDSSLKITAKDQVQFLKKLVKEELPVTKHAQQMTKSSLILEQNNQNVSLYGKTGAGYLENRVAHGWFIGWVEKDKNSYIFVSQIKDNKSGGPLNSIKAKKNAMEFLHELDIL